MIAEKYLQTIRDMRHEIEYLKKAREDVAKDIGYMSPSGMTVIRQEGRARNDSNQTHEEARRGRQEDS